MIGRRITQPTQIKLANSGLTGQMFHPSFNVHVHSIGAELSVVKTCELCKGSLTLDLERFDLEDYYRRHRLTQVPLETPRVITLDVSNGTG